MVFNVAKYRFREQIQCWILVGEVEKTSSNFLWQLYYWLILNFFSSYNWTEQDLTTYVLFKLEDAAPWIDRPLKFTEFYQK